MEKRGFLDVSLPNSFDIRTPRGAQDVHAELFYKVMGMGADKGATAQPATPVPREPPNQEGPMVSPNLLPRGPERSSMDLLPSVAFSFCKYMFWPFNFNLNTGQGILSPYKVV